jgi:superkiller protein 3
MPQSRKRKPNTSGKKTGHLTLLPGNASPEALLALANKKMEQDRYDEAEQILLGVRQKHPDFWIVYPHLYMLYTNEGRWDDALAVMRDYVDGQPDDLLGYRMLGMAAEQADDQATSRWAAEQLLKHDPTDLEAMMVLAAFAEEDGHPEAALAQYQAILHNDPNSVEAHMAIARFKLFVEGNEDEAEAAARTAVGLAPQDAETQVLLGQTLAIRRKLDEAMAAFRTAIALDPRHALAHLLLGTALSEQEKPDEAEAEMQQALTLGRDNPEFAAQVYGYLARHYLALDEPLEAIALLEEAEDGDVPLSPDLYVDFAAAYFHTQHYDDAIGVVEDGLALDPSIPELYHYSGLAKRALAQFGDAIVDFKHALELDPEFTSARIELGYTLGFAGLFKEAQEELQIALNAEPDDPAALTGMAMTLTSLGDPNGAIALARRAEAQMPEYTYSRYALINALLATDQRAEALAELARLKTDDPETAEQAEALFAQYPRE